MTLTLNKEELMQHIKQVLSPQTIHLSEKRIEFEDKIEKSLQQSSEEQTDKWLEYINFEVKEM